MPVFFTESASTAQPVREFTLGCDGPWNGDGQPLTGRVFYAQARTESAQTQGWQACRRVSFMQHQLEQHRNRDQGSLRRQNPLLNSDWQSTDSIAFKSGMLHKYHIIFENNMANRGGKPYALASTFLLQGF